MKRGVYVRVTCYLVPFPSPFSFATDLTTTAMLAIEIWTMEGWLCHNLSVGSTIRLAVRVREWRLCRGIFRSGLIQRIEGSFVLTREELFQFVKVPPLRDETFKEFA